MSKTKNTWIDDNSSRQTKFYLDSADDFIIERDTTRNILIQITQIDMINYREDINARRKINPAD